MLNNFIYSKLKSLFEEKLAVGEVPQDAIVFIEDTKEIWNHGTYFATQKSIEEIENIVASSETVQMLIARTATIKLTGDGTKYLNDKGEYVEISSNDNESNIATDLSNFYTKEEIDSKGYLTEHQDISHLATKDYVKEEINNKEVTWSDVYNKPNIFQLEFDPGMKIAVIGASNSTKSGRDAVEITVQPEDVGVQLSAYVTYYDIGTTIGGHTITESEVGTEITFTPISDDIGVQIGKPLTYSSNAAIKTWWMHLEEQFNCEVIPVCWSGSSISSHRESQAKLKCAHSWHESQIRKCGIRIPGTMERTAPDLIIFCRAGNDVTHEPFCTITENYFDSPTWTYPTTDLKSDGTYGALESFSLTIQKLREAYPMTPIVVGTMPFMKRVNYQTFPVNNGLYSWPYYNKKLREASEFFGIHTIDFDKVNITFENIYPAYAQDSAEKPVHQNNAGHVLLANQAIKDLISKVGDVFTLKLVDKQLSEDSLYAELPYRVYSETAAVTDIAPESSTDEMTIVADFQYSAPEQTTCKAQAPAGGYGGFGCSVLASSKTISFGTSGAGTYVLEEGHDYFISTTMKNGTITSSLYDGADDTLSTPLDTITRSAGSAVTRPIWIGNCYLATTSMYNQYRYNGLKVKNVIIYKQGEMIFNGKPAQRITDLAYGVLDAVSGNFYEETIISI